MALVLTEEQELLADTAKEFVAERSPVTAMRALRDSNDATGFSRDLYKEMAGLGWTGILLPEAHGGSDMGMAELGVVLEECGRTLVAQPFLSTVLLGASAVQLGGTDVQKQALLTGVSEGDTLLALAFQEKGRFDPFACSTKAEPAGDGFRITGEKLFVLDGHVADKLIVVARASGGPRDRDGLTLCIVDPAASGVSITRTTMVDGRNAARVRLDGVEVSGDQVIGKPGAGADVLEPVFDRATAGLCAEMLGTLTEAFERTVEYLKVREQFGVKIGTFQALKHRAAEMFCEVELSRSVTLEALRALDAGADDASKIVSAAKARVSDTAVLVSCEAVQMFGGIGMTDEEEIGLFLKRGHAATATLGDGAYHRDRFARLSGF